jgi:hypothetical protein
MFTRSKQNANEAQLQFRRENPITLCGRIAHTACNILEVKIAAKEFFPLHLMDSW